MVKSYTLGINECRMFVITDIAAESFTDFGSQGWMLNIKCHGKIMAGGKGWMA